MMKIRTEGRRKETKRERGNEGRERGEENGRKERKKGEGNKGKIRHTKMRLSNFRRA